MKKTTITILSCCLALTAMAQYTTPVAPANATMVIKYNGAKLTESVPVSKINSYSFIKDKLLSGLGLDSVSSIAQTGIDFTKETLQYALTEDSSNSFVTIVPLQNETDFLNLVRKGKNKNASTETKGIYKTMTLSDNTYLGWTPGMAVLVYTYYKQPYYGYPSVEETTIDTTVMAIPESMEEDVTEEAAIPMPPPVSMYEPENEEKKADPKVKKNSNAPIAKAPAEDTYETEGIVTPPAYDDIWVKDAPSQTEPDWYTIQQAYSIRKQKQIADSLIAIAFSRNLQPSIKSNPAYRKTVDASAPVSAWFNYDNLLSGFWSMAPRRLLGLYKYTGYGASAATGGQDISTGINLYFDKDKIRVEQKLFGGDPQTAQLLKNLFNNKQKSTLLSYISPGNIGFLSGSFSTEAVGKYYYRALKNYFSNSSILGRYSEMADIYIDLLEIMIDEKAIAELMPGNFVLVLHGLKTKQVSYTTYEYNDNFESKEVKKTRQELSPEFTIALETKRADFLQKLAAIPVKYAKEEKFNYSYKNGYYELVFDKEKDPINNLYFLVKEDRLVITTSIDMVHLALQKAGRKIPGDLKKFALKNNYAFKINTDQLLTQISPEINTETNKKIKDYLQQNIGNLQAESRIKDGMIHSTAIMDVKGNHKNSFELLFDMIEDINRILEADRKVSDKIFLE